MCTLISSEVMVVGRRTSLISGSSGGRGTTFRES